MKPRLLCGFKLRCRINQLPGNGVNNLNNLYEGGPMISTDESPDLWTGRVRVQDFYGSVVYSRTPPRVASAVLTSGTRRTRDPREGGPVDRFSSSAPLQKQAIVSLI